ncbi:MAG TPA: hypothetical protein VL832_03505 [Puia sp.]|nr:hypothetical protein [Puia sp.]
MQDIINGYITLLIALLVSLVFYKKLEPRWFRLFPWFLTVTLALQIVSYYYWVYTGKSNHIFYNIFIFPEYGFYILICYLAVKKASLKKLIALIGLAFTLMCLLLIGRDLHHYSSFSRNAGALLSFFCCVIFLVEMLLSDEVINFFRIPMFWIVTGIMIANLGTFLYFAFFDYILRNNLDPDGTVYIIITNSLSLTEFGFFAIGFLCNKIWKKIR